MTFVTVLTLESLFACTEIIVMCVYKFVEEISKEDFMKLLDLKGKGKHPKDISRILRQYLGSSNEIFNEFCKRKKVTNDLIKKYVADQRNHHCEMTELF